MNIKNLLKPDRVVCGCYGITVRDIKSEIDKGRNTFDDMVSSIRLGVLCSACIADAKAVISALNNENPQ